MISYVYMYAFKNKPFFIYVNILFTYIFKEQYSST